MSSCQECAAVRAASSPHPKRRPAKPLPGMRATSRGHVAARPLAGHALHATDPRIDLRSERGCYVADCCGGTGGVCKSVERRGCRGRLSDIALGPHCDMTAPIVIQQLIRVAFSDLLLAAMIAITCTSWPQARNRTNVIRTRHEPWGVSHPHKPFSEKDRLRLREGNLQVRRLIPFLRILHKLKIPWIIENPASVQLVVGPVSAQVGPGSPCRIHHDRPMRLRTSMEEAHRPPYRQL